MRRVGGSHRAGRALLFPLIVGLATGAALAAGAVPVDAQSSRELTTPRPVGEPAWLSAWSPLRPMAELVLRRPGADPVLTGLLVEPAPRLGAFWTAGNPGALAREVESRHTGFRSGYDAFSGGYRRPLDPGTQIHRRLEGRAWGSLGGSGAGIGHVSVLRSRFAGGTAGFVPVPYATSPLAVGDSLGHSMSRTSVRVEGAGGWRVGPVSFGLALGFEGQEARSVASPVPRSVRVADPGVSAGITWQPVEGAPRVGAYGRWRKTVRSLQAFAQTAPDRVFEFVGFDEPLEVGLSPGGGGLYSRRLERDARAVGGSVSGRELGLRWVVYGQRETLRNGHLASFAGQPNREIWEADGWSGGLGAETSLLGHLRARVVGRYRTLSGDLRRPEFDEPTYRAEMSRWRWVGDLRLMEEGPWEGALRLQVRRDARSREDRPARVASQITAWESGLGVEAGRRLTGGLRMAVGAGLVRYVPTTARIPLPSAMGELYERWIAPEMALYATGAWVRSGSVTLSLDVRPGTRLWLRAADAAASPDDPRFGLEHRPREGRGGLRLEFGVRTGEP